MSIAKLNARRKAAGLPLIRFAVRNLLAEDLQDLRDAYSAMYEISATAVGDRRGYWALARGHGYDQDLCHNDDRVFLTWHRAYVYAFEKALSTALKWKRGDEGLELTLPFWDWTLFDAATDAANGIPRSIDDATFVDLDGAQQSNPLKSALSMYRITSQGLAGPARFTTRSPGAFRATIPQLASDVARYLTNPDFARFSSDLNFGAHGTVHVRVGGAGGDMSQVVSAAYDPIFWLHHSMIDKIWFDWQQIHGDATVPQHVREAVVYDSFVGEELLDAERSLLYIYSNDSVEAAEEVGGTVPDVAEPPDDGPAPDPGGQPPGGTPPGPGTGASPGGGGTPPAGTPPSGAPPAGTPPSAGAPPGAGTPGHPLYPVLALGDLVGGFRRAQLDFHQLRPPRASYEIRAYINNPGATAETSLDDSSYAGRLVLFGHGECHGATGHCNPALARRDDYDLRDKHPLRYDSTKYVMDVTRGLRRALQGATKAKRISITLVTLDAAGDPVPQDRVRYRGVSLSTR